MIIDKNLTFYIVPSWKCNLRCPHCFVNNISEKANKDLLIKTIKECHDKYPNASYILHGGEPTFNKELLKELLDLNIINSITTNMLYNDDEISDIINKANIDLATSWNPSRFRNNALVDLWNHNLENHKQPVMVLITLDQDLLKLSASEIVSTIKTFKNVDSVLFEPLLDNSLTDEFQDKVDTLLCEIYKRWDIRHIKNLIAEQILNWNFGCNTKTILPDGSIRNKCTMADSTHKPVFLAKCLKCKYNRVCIPCSLHTRCSFFPKFYNMMKNA